MKSWLRVQFVGRVSKRLPPPLLALLFVHTVETSVDRAEKNSAL